MTTNTPHPHPTAPEPARFDVVIIGAGISGLDAAIHLSRYNKELTFQVLERRAAVGGTWDLFKYPGIRSDSDMYTFGFGFKPWGAAKPIAPGGDIKNYLAEAADEYGVTGKIRFNTEVASADWVSADEAWHLTTADGSRLDCRFLFSCTGYYSHDTPHRPAFPNEAAFKGRIIHPQEWRPEVDNPACDGKRVAVIGSGATAITLVPSLVEPPPESGPGAPRASHVTMVQRSPTYIFAQGEIDYLAVALAKVLPPRAASFFVRWKQIAFFVGNYFINQNFPYCSKLFFRAMARRHIGDAMTAEEVKKHFSPPYNPWDQR